MSRYLSALIAVLCLLLPGAVRADVIGLHSSEMTVDVNVTDIGSQYRYDVSFTYNDPVSDKSDMWGFFLWPDLEDATFEGKTGAVLTYLNNQAVSKGDPPDNAQLPGPNGELFAVYVWYKDPSDPNYGTDGIPWGLAGGFSFLSPYLDTDPMAFAYNTVNHGRQGETDFAVGMTGYSPAPVPEPGTMILLGSGLLALTLLRKKAS